MIQYFENQEKKKKSIVQDMFVQSDIIHQTQDLFLASVIPIN